MIYLMIIFLMSKIRKQGYKSCFVLRAPQSKQLREDNRGRPYIKDIKEIEVRTSEEAIDLFNMGLKRRRIAHTHLNRI
jgi:2-methylcitrate dehydratase PrpD